MIDYDTMGPNLYGGTKPVAEEVGFLDREGPAPDPASRPPMPGAEDQARAERMYGEQKPEPAPVAHDPKATEPDESGVPKNIAELRQSEGVERRMYTAAKTFERVDTESLFDANADPEAIAAAGAELREIFADHGATPEEAQHVATLGKTYPIGTVNEDQHASWYAQAHAALVADLGPGADAALRDAQRLVQRDPRVVMLLSRTGLGSHPAVVQLFVKLAAEQKSRGRLR